MPDTYDRGLGIAQHAGVKRRYIALRHMVISVDDEAGALDLWELLRRSFQAASRHASPQRPQS